MEKDAGKIDLINWQRRVENMGYYCQSVSMGGFTSEKDQPDEIELKVIFRKEGVIFKSEYPEPQS